VYDDLSIQANLTYFAQILGAPASAVPRVLDVVDLTAVRRRPVGRVSGGQRNRVSLAVALLGEPELLVLDEPTVGLDPLLRRNLWSLLRRIADDGTTILVTSHVMDEAEYCDQIVLLREGTVVADASCHALLHETGTSCIEDAFVHLIAS
jgi:ABC-2 type transport system ATP-binding protein